MICTNKDQQLERVAYMDAKSEARGSCALSRARGAQFARQYVLPPSYIISFLQPPLSLAFDRHGFLCALTSSPARYPNIDIVRRFELAISAHRARRSSLWRLP